MTGFPFHISKAHAHHSISPAIQQVTAMLHASTIIDVENILQQTGYGKLLEIVRPSVNLSEFEIAMRREYASLLHRYQSTAPKELFELLHAYSLMIEAENMNLILQAILHNNVTEDLVQNISYQHSLKILNNEISVDNILALELQLG